ncbi:20015_t:CDS:2, partial [Gigaspora margarita]
RTQTEQMTIDTEFHKENPLKVLMELDPSNNKLDKNIDVEPPQGKSTDSINENQNLYPFSEIYKRRRKENNESSMEVDTNTVQSEIGLVEKFVSRDKNIASPNTISIISECRFGKQKENIRVNEISSGKRHSFDVGKGKIETKNKENHRHTTFIQEETQVNTILQEILNQLELIENRQTGHTSSVANNQ